MVNVEPRRDETVSREVLWWDGIELAPPRPRQGLLAKIWETYQKKEQQNIFGDYHMHLLAWSSMCLYIRMTWKCFSLVNSSFWIDVFSWIYSENVLWICSVYKLGETEYSNYHLRAMHCFRVAQITNILEELAALFFRDFRSLQLWKTRHHIPPKGW